MRTPSPRDIQVFEKINRHYTHPVLDRLMTTVTHVGLGGVQLPMVLTLWWFTRNGAGANLWWTTILAFLLSTAIVHLIKRRVKRLRPVMHTEVRFLVAETRAGSFPSGHTATTFALATVLAWHFPMATVPVFALASLIGYSRVYVGVHFLTDVLAAAAIGVVSGALVMLRTLVG